METSRPAADGRQALRHAVGRLLPAPARNVIDQLRARHVMSVIAPANAEFVRRNGLTVTGGPFTGMRCLPGQERVSGDLVGKLAGFYEHELHAVMYGWRDAGLGLIVNVGCAEGYYAVGLARLLPVARVLAYDIDPSARARCAELTQLNGVSDRVQIAGECTPEALAGLPPQGVGLFCDCEGYERTLLDPAIAPALSGWTILVELHDFIDPTITDTVTERFAGSHEIELIPSATATKPAPPELEFMTTCQRAAVLSERPVAMSWASMRPCLP